MTSFRQRYDVYATSYRLRIDVETTLSVSGDATFKTISSVKIIFLGFSAMMPNSYAVRKVLEYHLFRILHFA